MSFRVMTPLKQHIIPSYAVTLTPVEFAGWLTDGKDAQR